MKPRPVFGSRDFAGPWGGLIGAQFQVNAMSWDTLGGPLEAEIKVTGSEKMLWDLFNLLRCPVVITDQFGYCWWGMVNQVVVETPGMGVTSGLDELYNRIAVAYSYIGPGTNTVGVRKTTAWVQDDPSVTVFGTKEFLSSQSGMTDAAAESQRDAILARCRLPVGAPDLGDHRTLGATIQCRGWWETMKWQYASVPAIVSVSYTTLGAAEQAVGSQNGDIRVMQQFTVGANAINLVQIAIAARKVGNPTDNLSLSVMALDDKGNPTGSSLGSTSIPGGSLSSTHAWAVGTANEKQLEANTQYGLQISRSGQVDANNYYKVNVNTALGYTGGVFRVYNSSSWNDRAPNADMPFKILANRQVETTQQIADLVTNYGQFLIGTTILNGSGIIQGSFRNGDKTARQEVEALLKAATKNGRRLFVWVTRERRVIISEEPDPADNTHYQINSRGELYEDGGRYMRLIPPVGKWTRVTARPKSGAMVSTEQQLISGGSWSPDNGLKIATFGQPGPQEILGVQR